MVKRLSLKFRRMITINARSVSQAVNLTGLYVVEIINAGDSGGACAAKPWW